MVRLDVTDTGVGMDEEALERVFEPYFSTKTTGTGLGLPIARRNIELNGGSIEVRSAKGAGTTVTRQAADGRWTFRLKPEARCHAAWNLPAREPENTLTPRFEVRLKPENYSPLSCGDTSAGAGGSSPATASPGLRRMRVTIHTTIAPTV